MVKRYKYKKPRTATVSTVPAIYKMREMVEEMNMLANEMPKRVARGRELFLLAAANTVRKSVLQKAPDIEIGGVEFDYATEMRIVIVDGSDDEDAVAIYFKGQENTLNEATMNGRALYFQAKQGSPEWVETLMVYGPWPSHMVPIPSAELKAKVISRTARKDELEALADRLYLNRGDIERDFRLAGAPNVTIDKTANAVGLVVNEDVGYNILRVEFGYDGLQQVAHWRPALAQLKDEMPNLMQMYLNYLQTGRESAFKLPKNVGNVNTVVVKKGAAFAKALAPFAPKG